MMNKILKKIKSFFKLKTYNIIIDQGLFTIKTDPEFQSMPNTVVYVMKTMKLPSKFNYSSIRVRNEQTGEYVNIKLEYDGSQTIWSFIMPAADVKISPIVRRRGKH